MDAPPRTRVPNQLRATERAQLPRLAVSMGCPAGIGPEVGLRAAVECKARVLLVGDARAFDRAARVQGLDAGVLRRVERPQDAWSLPPGALAVWQPTESIQLSAMRSGKPTPTCGLAQLRWIDAACDVVTSGVCDALVTGPVSKAAIVSSRAREARTFRGHTEHLQRRLRAKDVVMAFWTPRLTTSLVTTHLPLADVPGAITRRKVEGVVVHTAHFLFDVARAVGGGSTRLAVAALNPHAGEGGLLGKEEEQVIGPALERARARLAKLRVKVGVDGPLPAETAFRKAAGGAYQGVVAMYHDQATIPMKVLSFGEAVNVSLGLPIIRTSVDHGTGYDIAGKGIADASGMASAMSLAATLVRSRAGTV